MHQYMETEASYNPYIQAGSSLFLANQRQIPSVLTLDKVVLMSQATDLRAGSKRPVNTCIYLLRNEQH